MRVGILGSGLMGTTIFAQARHEVVFSYARSIDKLKRLAREARARAGSPDEAAQDADALLLAVHWSRIHDVLKQAGDVSGKVIVTCCLPMDAGNTKLILGTTPSGAEELARKVPQTKIVCTFNTVPSECYSVCSRPRARRLVRASCTAATTRKPRSWWPDSSATWVLSR
jgi:8-hydroxy-5-deazaflavin:NADPH oxidoreductase